jgi:peptidoglycan/LPS O-acetylase OafA/YrhL
MRRLDDYIHFLLGIALMAVVALGMFDWGWLSLAFPALGILFAVTAEHMAATLSRDGSARVFLRRSALGLLAPFWIFAAVVVPVMWSLGWRTGADTDARSLDWSSGWLWVLPVFDPPASTEGLDWTVPLWFVRTCLWFMVLTPPLLWLFRRWPLRLMAIPVITTLLITVGIANFTDPAYDVVIRLCAFGCCWLLGFAHYDDKLRKISVARTVAGGTVLIALGLWLLNWKGEAYAAEDIYDVPLASMLYGLGAVWILLRLDPMRTGPARLPFLRGSLSFIGRRSITIYVWANFSIAMTPLVVERSPLAQYYGEDVRGRLLGYGAAWVLILTAAALVGWAEDLRTDRGHRLLARGRARAPQPASTPVLKFAVDIEPYPEPRRMADLEPSPEPNFVVDMGHRSTASACRVETERDRDEVSPLGRSDVALGRPAAVPHPRRPQPPTAEPAGSGSPYGATTGRSRSGTTPPRTT